MQQQEIWLVKYEPSVGHEFKKIRPAIVVCSDTVIKTSNVISVLPLTGNLNNKIKNDIIIKKNNQNNLFSDSVIKVHYISSFDKTRFIKKVGIISRDNFFIIKKYLKQHFDI